MRRHGRTEHRLALASQTQQSATTHSRLSSTLHWLTDEHICIPSTHAYHVVGPRPHREHGSPKILKYIAEAAGHDCSRKLHRRHGCTISTTPSASIAGLRRTLKRQPDVSKVIFSHALLLTGHRPAVYQYFSPLLLSLLHYHIPEEPRETRSKTRPSCQEGTAISRSLFQENPTGECGG